MKLLAAQELGLPPVVTAASGMWIIESSLTISARTMLALLLRSKVVAVKIIESTEQRCEIEMSRTDMDFSMTEVLTLEQAHARGLTKGSGGAIKANWEHHPKEMLWARTISFLARRVAADIIGGLYVPEDFGETDVTARVSADDTAEPSSPLMLAHNAEKWRIEFLQRYLVDGLHLDGAEVAAKCKELRNTVFGGRLIADLTVAEANDLRERMSQWAVQQVAGEPGIAVESGDKTGTLEGDFDTEHEQETAATPSEEPAETLFPNGGLTTLTEWTGRMEEVGCGEDLRCRLRAFARGLTAANKVNRRAIPPPETPDEMAMLIDVSDGFLSGEITEAELPSLHDEPEREGPE